MKEERAAELAAEYGFDLRTPMDSSIKMCRIAEGSADIYPRHGPTMEWDTAAGHAILDRGGRPVHRAGRRSVRVRQGRPGLPQRLVRGA
jgi:3'-phosphoadenosine 5'-phosphosulfate (PAPS) 3'-phosphatase